MAKLPYCGEYYYGAARRTWSQPLKRKRPRDHRGLCCAFRDTGYCNLVEMSSNFVLRMVPIPLTATMITTEIPAAIRPDSMAVAPDSSFTKRAIRFFTGLNLLSTCWSN